MLKHLRGARRTAAASQKLQGLCAPPPPLGAKHGIQAGDRLVSWNGEPVAGVREWMGMMIGHEPGDIVTVGIIRDGETIDVPVMLKPR